MKTVYHNFLLDISQRTRIVENVIIISYNIVINVKYLFNIYY